jgi:hypothetical protein
MNKKDDALQQLFDCFMDGKPVTEELFSTFRQLLAQPEQEPVAEYIGETPYGSHVQLFDDVKKGTKFYTAPHPQQEPAQEPVAWTWDTEWNGTLTAHFQFNKPEIERGVLNLRALYTSPNPNPKQYSEPVALDEYDAGLLNDWGGGKVEWWQDYIRAELGRAHDFYQSQVDSLTAPQHQSLTVPQEPIGWQFYEDGKWHYGMEINNHRENTEAAGIPTRNFYAAPAVQPNPADTLAKCQHCDCPLLPIGGGKSAPMPQPDVMAGIADLEQESRQLRAQNEPLTRMLAGVVERLEQGCGASAMPPLLIRQFIQDFPE